MDCLIAIFPGQFGVSGRCDGTLQLTYDNKPLYFYASDNNPGDVNGEGVGGVWWLVKAPVAPTCTDGIQNGSETGIDCGGNCPNSCSPGAGQCEGYGVTIVNGQGILYSHESLGQVCYMCTGPGYQGCVPVGAPVDGFYQLEVNVTPGQEYSFGIQCGPNVIVTGIAGENDCYFAPSCTDGFQNGSETGVDCGGSCPACPTCDDGIQNGDETGVDCGGSNCTGNNADCATVCNGTPNPKATVSSSNESVENAADGSITFTFNDVSGRTTLKFSIDGGSSYAYSVPDNSGSYTVDNLAPGTYNTWVKWENNDCPINLGSVNISEGGPVPTCSDGIRNQGEEGVDCGGPCADCPPNNCSNLPLVDYPIPALPTPIVGVPAKSEGFSFDLSLDKSTISVDVGPSVAVQMGGNAGSFEFFCSCNQIEFSSVALGNTNTATVPQACQDAGDFYYFFRYKKNGNTTLDPGDIYHYSALFTTEGERIDPDNRPTITTKAANWMRYSSPTSTRWYY